MNLMQGDNHRYNAIITKIRKPRKKLNVIKTNHSKPVYLNKLIIIMSRQMFVKRKSLILGKNFSTNFALHSRFVTRPSAMRHDVTRMFKFAAECFVALSAVEELVPSLEMQF